MSSSNNGTATHSLTLTATVVSNLQACGGQRRAPVPADMPMVNRLYPNPASGTFYVELNELKGNASLRMVNSQGIAVMNISITRSVQPVDISKIKPGLYVVSVIDAGGNEIFNRKLVIR